MRNAKWWLPILLMVLIAPFTPFLDLNIERFFYQKGVENGSLFVSNAYTSFLFEYGPLPAWIVIGCAAILYLLSFCWSIWKKWRAPSLILLLTLAIGSGFITHALLKDHWGRPRPKQVTEFGGIQPFRPFYEPNFSHQPEPSKSFPCGHCTMGFFFFAVAIIGKRQNNISLYWLGMIVAITLGTALSISRMAQGGHFLSDTLMSALIMWLTALTCDWLIYSENKR